MLETARGVLDADKIAAASRDSEMRLAGFVFGPNDISRETRIRMQPGRAAMIPMITHCILATRAHGLEILDGPYSDIANVDGFAAECAQGRDLGFDGKTLIHPSHIEACNAIFTPPAEEVALARKIIAAFTCRKTPRAARFSSMAVWWSDCTPTWRGARSQSLMRSRRWPRRRISRLSASPRRCSTRSGNSPVMLSRGAGGKLAVAMRLVPTQPADPLHVAKHKRLYALEVRLVDTKAFEHFRQFVGAVLAEPEPAARDRRRKSASRSRSGRNRSGSSGGFRSAPGDA